MKYISRENGAKKLGVSTRTVDRYIKKGKISYKKSANKVLLLEQDVLDMLSEFKEQKQEPQVGEVIQEAKNSPKKKTDLNIVSPSVDKIIDDKLNKFFTVFQETDKKLKEKDATILTLQQQIIHMENQMKQMIALPDYSQEKKELSTKIKELKTKLQNEKIKSTVRIGLLTIIIALGILFLLLNKGF